MSKVPGHVLHQNHWGVAAGRVGRGASAWQPHIRMQKHLRNEVLRVTIPAHKPVKRSTLSHILKQARIDVDEFIGLL